MRQQRLQLNHLLRARRLLPALPRLPGAPARAPAEELGSQQKALPREELCAPPVRSSVPAGAAVTRLPSRSPHECRPLPRAGGPFPHRALQLPPDLLLSWYVTLGNLVNLAVYRSFICEIHDSHA